MRSTISFSEVCGNAHVEAFLSSALQDMNFPISGELSCGEENKNQYVHKGGYFESDKTLLDIQTTLSWIMSRKNEKWEASFYIAQTLGIQVIIEVVTKEEKDDLSLHLHELSENKLSEDISLIPLFMATDSLSLTSFNLLDIEDYPLEPDGSYDYYLFNQQALKGGLWVSPDKKIMFQQLEDGSCKRIWDISLCASVKRFFKNKLHSGVLSQTIVDGRMVSLLENGEVHIGTKSMKIEGVPRETYQYLVELAEAHYRGGNIHTELTPCLFQY